MTEEEREKREIQEYGKPIKDLTKEERDALKKEYMSRRYKGALCDWTGGSIQFFQCHTLEEAVEKAKEILNGPSYSSVPIVDTSFQDYEKIIVVVEKQPLTWNTVVLKGKEEINKNSLYPWGLDSLERDLKDRKEEAQK